MGNTVEIPTDIFRKFARAAEAFDDLQDALEDFLISHNPAFLRRLRKARREQLAGKTRPWEEFKRELDRTNSRKR